MKFDDKIFSTLTDEQKRLVEEAKTPDDLLKIAKETGYELSQEQLDHIAGGWDPDPFCTMDCEGVCQMYCPEFIPCFTNF